MEIQYWVGDTAVVIEGSTAVRTARVARRICVLVLVHDCLGGTSTAVVLVYS